MDEEVERLRAEVEAYRQRELTDLRSALAAMREERDHYRAEAKRIEAVGRQVAHEYEAKLQELKTKLAIYTHVDVSARPGRILPSGR